MRRAVFLLILLPLCLGIPALARAGDEAPADAARAAEIDRLVRQLGDEDYARREAASQRLLEIGAPAREALERTLRDSKDMEVRWRAEQLLLRLGGAGERRMDDDESAPAAPPPGEEAPPAAPPGAGTPFPPGLPGPSPDMEEFLKRIEEAWRRMDQRFGARPPLEQKKIFRAPGLELSVDVFGLIARVRLDVQDPQAGAAAPRTYVGRSLDEILARNPDLAKLEGMAALEEQWDGFKRANPNLFPFDSFFGDRGAQGGGGQVRITLDGFGQGTEIHEVGDKVVVKLHDTDENGKRTTRTFEGASLDEIREEHPEIADRLPVDLGDITTGRTRLWRRLDPRGLLPPTAPTTPGDAQPTATFGVQVRDLDPVLAMHLRLDGTQGVLVTDVLPGSQAEELGLERYDVLLTVNGEAIRNVETAVIALKTVAQNRAPVRLGIIRRGQPRVLER